MDGQNLAILRYLENHKDGITPKDAYKMFGCLRLSARIFDLRNKGYEIVTLQEQTVNQFGNNVNYARYRLKQYGKGNK